MTTLEPTLEVLAVLARAETPDPKATVGVITDLGRALVDPPDGSLGELEAALAAARVRFTDRSGLDSAPLEVLNSNKSDVFVAGALWACGDLVSAYSRQLHAQRERRAQRSKRESVRRVTMELLERQQDVSPSEIRLELSKGVKQDIPKDTVSKALSDLLKGHQIEPAPHRPRASRRESFFRATQRSEQPLPAEFAEIRESLKVLTQRFDVGEVLQMVSEALQNSA